MDFFPSEYFGVAWQQLSQGRCSLNEVWISCTAVTEVKRGWLFCLSFVKADDPLSISVFEFSRLLNHIRWQLSNILKIQCFAMLELFSTESFHLLPVSGFPCSLVSVLPVKDTWDLQNNYIHCVISRLHLLLSSSPPHSLWHTSSIQPGESPYMWLPVH